MKNHLVLWANRLIEGDSLSLRTKFRVVGERDQHLGPRWEFARIQVCAEPSTSFEVIDRSQNKDKKWEETYKDWAIFGLLDILLASEPFPLRNIRLIFEKSESHGVDSSPIAFLHAGRDAGRKIFLAIRDHAEGDR